MQTFPHSFLILSDAQLWIDLEAVGNVRSWGDGTIYEDTAISEVANLIVQAGQNKAFRAVSRGFDDKSKSTEYRPLCQANPSGIEW